jgi:hypothetical protein
MLKALQVPTEAAAVQQWAGALDSNNLAIAADSIQSYTFAYRKQIMARLPPAARSVVWQRHIQQYLNRHPELDDTAVVALKAAQSALTPRALSEPTTEDRASLNAAADQVQALLGKDEALYLLHQLGPRDGTFASAEPITMKLASFVRNQFVVSARDGDCGCASGWGCGGYSLYCSNEETCQWIVTWPMCGWAWMSVCDGMCAFW